MDTLYGTPFAPFGPRRPASRTGGQAGGGVPAADMRVSDAERAEVADQLSKHYSDGRLDETELNERLGKAMSSKTRGDLAGLLYDLPRPAAAPVPAPRRTLGSKALGLLPVVFLLLSFVSAGLAWHWHGGAMLLLLFVGLLAWRRHHRHLHRWHGGHPGCSHFGQSS